ncbi:MAG: 16S rRNA (uracil(1498)-N(3))-methyltransferase [Marinagarivorans sp.]|nr:16S rRNA (uracil(1498)-N(3))-methyltransferase [Marinagarivorans sp.]
MRIPRIYTQATLASNSTVELEESLAHYLGKVLRMEAGRELIVFNGQGGAYAATLAEVGKKSAAINVGAWDDQDRESPLKTHLAIGLSRGERWDLVLQKATELGVTEITPLFTERCEVKLHGDKQDKKFDHWQGIIISACEQCQRNIVPQLNAPQKFDDFIKRDEGHGELNLVLHHRSDKKLSDYAAPKNCTLLIGPEGGLSEDEIVFAQKSHFNALTLGPRVLRTETAPLAALSVLQLAWGDF